MILKIENLRVETEGKEILKDINLEIKKGEVQAILGPNASGKSTLARVVAGDRKYNILGGKIFFEGKNLKDISAEERARIGIAISWQHPPNIKGVKLSGLIEKISKNREKPDFGENLMDREVNLNFSGGEKKISELMQIISLNPKLVIFDEIDSGLDIKKLEKVAEIIKKELVEKGVSVVLITHNGEILDFLKPAFVNVLVDGKFICRDKDLGRILNTIREYGYEKCRKCELHSERP